MKPDYWDLCDKGYEAMAFMPTYDDACDAEDYYMEGSTIYADAQIVRYKRIPGEEGAYAVMVLSIADGIRLGRQALEEDNG